MHLMFSLFLIRFSWQRRHSMCIPFRWCGSPVQQFMQPSHVLVGCSRQTQSPPQMGHQTNRLHLRQLPSTHVRFTQTLHHSILVCSFVALNVRTWKTFARSWSRCVHDVLVLLRVVEVALHDELGEETERFLPP